MGLFFMLRVSIKKTPPKTKRGVFNTKQLKNVVKLKRLRFSQWLNFTEDAVSASANNGRHDRYLSSNALKFLHILKAKLLTNHA